MANVSPVPCMEDLVVFVAKKLKLASNVLPKLNSEMATAIILLIILNAIKVIAIVIMMRTIIVEMTTIMIMMATTKMTKTNNLKKTITKKHQNGILKMTIVRNMETSGVKSVKLDMYWLITSVFLALYIMANTVPSALICMNVMPVLKDTKFVMEPVFLITKAVLITSKDKIGTLKMMVVSNMDLNGVKYVKLDMFW